MGLREAQTTTRPTAGCLCLPPATAAGDVLWRHFQRVLSPQQQNVILAELAEASLTFDEFARRLCAATAPVFVAAMKAMPASEDPSVSVVLPGS